MADFKGFSWQEAQKQLERYGKNELVAQSRYSVVTLIINQFKSPLIIVLMGAMGITFLLGDRVDTLVIGLAVLMNTTLGFWQEYKAERALEALAKVIEAKAVTLREEKKVEVLVSDLVPGDVVYLYAGEKVPADGILLRAHGVMISEAVLTGESAAISKKSGEDQFIGVEKRKGSEITGSVYAGTVILAGEAVMRVVATGMRTEVGKIAQELIETKEEPTPMQKQLTELSRKLALGVLIMAVILFGVGIKSGVPVMEMFTVAVAVAVSAIPEGLVISLTAILAVGMQRILKRRALVRKLMAAEVLGSVSVICTDKTGTLTEGKLSVYQTIVEDMDLMDICAVAITRGNDPLEMAFHQYGKEKVGESKANELRLTNRAIDKWPFTSERRFSLTLTEHHIFMVGAPEEILNKTALAAERRSEFINRIKSWTKEGYRVVGIAQKINRGEKTLEPQVLDGEWSLVGLISYQDKVRPGLIEVLKKTAAAGIEVKVITGDYAETAVAVMEQLGWEIKAGEVVTGEELIGLTPEKLADKVLAARIFARITPSMKLVIVKALKDLGKVVAMTGDGVNDAPALKKADIGIVVANATEVAKETADMVLLDSNFHTIVAAVEEGRGIFKNMRKVLLYLLSDSFTEMILIIGTFLVGLPVPLSAVQILWVNLVNDGFPGLALTIDPHLHNLLEGKPRRITDSIIDAEIAMLIGLISLVTGAMVLFGYWWKLLIGSELAEARTFAFALLGVDSLLYVFSSRSLRTPLWRDVPWRNPWLIGAAILGLGFQLISVYVPFLQRLLGTVPLPLSDWWLIGIMSLGVMMIIETVKAVFINRRRI